MNTKNIAKATKKNDTKSESNISRNLNDVFQLPPVLHNQIKIIRTNDTCFKDYSILGSLGKGTYAQVWKVKNKITNEIFAAKLLQPSQFPKESFNRIVEMFTKEIINLSICQCPGVVKLHKVIGGTEGWVLIQDYVNDGTLWKENLTNSMEEAFLYFIQLFQGMCYIQDMNIVHRDLKPTNILKHDNKKIVIADFGWSEHVDSCNLHPSEWPGTLEINPPEVLRNTGPMTEKIDNYALGMNMILFVSGRFVCRQKGVECSKVAQTILKTVHNLRHSKPPSKFRSNMKAWDLFVKLTCSNPNERISLEKVLYHPWVTEMLNSLSIQNSRFIWYEKVKSRWIYLLSNNWNFLRNMSAAPKNYKQLPAEQSSVPKGETGNKIHIDNNIKKNSSDDTRKAQHVEIHCNNKQEEKTTSVVDAHKESDCKDMFTLTKTNYKNKREECSTQKKEDIPVDKLRTGETTVALSPKERNKDLERGKEKDRTREVPNKTMICEKDAKFTCEKKDEIIKKNIKEQCRYNCEKTTMLNAYGNKSKEQIKTNEQNGNEADEDDDEEYEEDEEEDDDEDDDEDDEEDEEEEEDDDEVEEKEECGSKLRKQNIANKLCTNNDKFKNPITNYYKHTKVHQLLQIDPTNAETTENRKLSNKIDNSFLNFVEKKNLNIPKNLMKNDSLEENSTLAEKTFEENSSKNKERSINYENNSHFNCTKNHDAYIKVLTKNFQASKLKVPQMFYDSFVKGAHSKDMSSLFGHSENLKKSRNEVHDKGKTKGDIFNQKEETSKNKLKINTNELYPDINLKGSFEKLDMHLKKEMEKIEKAQKNKKDVNKEKLFSCIKEHNHISEINVDSLGDMKKYIIDDKIKNIMPSENYKNENVKEGDKQNDNESIPDVYENIIEKCLKKTNEKAFSKYGELSEKKNVNTKNCFVHKLFNENVELTLDNRNEEKERTDAKYMEQYIIAKKKIGDNFSRNEHNNRYTFNKNETNTDKNKTELLKESGLDVNKYENFNRYLFKHNKNKEDNNRVLYQSTGKLRPTCVENLFEKFGTNNKKDIDNYGGSNNNRSLASKAKIYKNTVTHGNNNNKDNQGSDFMKNLSFLSNECNNNYSTKSKVSSSTFNSNVSSDVNNSIIDNFVNNTKKDKTDGVYHNGYFNILREKNSAEHKKSNSFLNISQTTQKTNTCATKSQELITTDMSACKTKWDLNRKSKFVAKFIPYDQNSMDSVKTDSNDGSKIEERNGIKYVGKKTECKNIMKETDKNENAFFKLSNPNKCNETILEDFSEKFLKNKIDDTANNERMKPAEINEKKHLYYQLMNNPHYQKLMNTYNEEPSSTFLNKLTNKEHKTNAYADNDIGKNNTNDNNKSNIYQYMNSQISNTNNYTKSTLYLNDNSKEHIGKTSSASTFECSDFDAHYSSNKELIESFNSDHNFLTKDKYSFENKKKPEKIFAQFK